MTAFDDKYNVIIFSHNGGRFDTHFIVNEAYRQKGLLYDSKGLKMSGNKIFEFKVQKPGFANLLFR